MLVAYRFFLYCWLDICCLFQAPAGENQPSVGVELFVSTERILILNKDLDVRVFCYLMLYLHYNSGALVVNLQ